MTSFRPRAQVELHELFRSNHARVNAGTWRAACIGKRAHLGLGLRVWGALPAIHANVQMCSLVPRRAFSKT